jgi:hypothetical protein
MDALVESLSNSNLDDEQEPARSEHASDASEDESNEVRNIYKPFLGFTFN